MGIRAIHICFKNPLRYPLRHHRQSAVRHMIGTGGQSQKGIPILGRDTSVVQGQFLDIVIKILKFLLRLRLIKLLILKHIVLLCIDLRQKNRYNFIAALFI